jgi:hypothetical protein
MAPRAPRRALRQLLPRLLLLTAAARAQTYAPLGPQADVPEAALIGWAVCHSSSFDSDGTPLADLLAACSAPALMLACRPVGSDTFSLLAWAPRADALWDAGATATGSRLSNGAQWYYSESWSWGFAGAGDVVDRTEW